MKEKLFVAIFVFFILNLNGQYQAIKLNNPSFEGIPGNSHPPKGWVDCGFPGETSVDIQPGQFRVDKKPFHGNTYLGMVVRDNNTWESVAQELSNPLKKGMSYRIKIHLRKPATYISQSSTTVSMLINTTPPSE